MTLIELHEDLFQYVCSLNRAVKAGAHLEYGRVRADLKSRLDEIKRSAASDMRLMKQAAKLELPLVFFVDNVICTSRLKFAGQWASNRLATERNELAGDERFFDFFEQDLVDVSEEAAERLTVYYTCFGLGFMGMYQSQPDQIRRYMEQIFPRIRPWVDSSTSAKICEEAYKFTDTRLLTEPPSGNLLLVVILFIFLSLSVLAVCYGLYAKAVGELGGSIKDIERQAEVAKP